MMTLVEGKLIAIDEDVEEIYIGNLKTRKINRGGKNIMVKKSTKEGYKNLAGREVRMSSKEKRTRKLAQKRGARKRKAKKAQTARSMKKSLRKAKSWHS